MLVSKMWHVTENWGKERSTFWIFCIMEDALPITFHHIMKIHPTVKENDVTTTYATPNKSQIYTRYRRKTSFTTPGDKVNYEGNVGVWFIYLFFLTVWSIIDYKNKTLTKSKFREKKPPPQIEISFFKISIEKIFLCKNFEEHYFDHSFISIFHICAFVTTPRPKPPPPTPISNIPRPTHDILSMRKWISSERLKKNELGKSRLKKKSEKFSKFLKKKSKSEKSQNRKCISPQNRNSYF